MGDKYGIVKGFKDLNSEMFAVHCFWDLLNLSLSDPINKVKSIKSIFSTKTEICILVKKSPQRDIKLEEMHKVSKNQYKGWYGKTRVTSYKVWVMSY